MHTVDIKLPNTNYQVLSKAGILGHIGEIVSNRFPHEVALVIADSNVAPIYGELVLASLRDAGYKRCLAYSFPAGETAKTLDQVRLIYEVLLNAGCERKSPVIALGGGVTGDLVGFAASTYLRGVPLVQCPTTLLAMVDSSVGGKVGVNLPQGKNLVGSFYHPAVVLADVQTLKTLPMREIRCGLAECIKHAVLSGPESFTWMEEHLDSILSLNPSLLAQLVQANVKVKAAIVMEDEREQGKRAWLNLGHTFGHALEATSGYSTLNHGEAVALGLLAASTLACSRGMWEEKNDLRLRNLILRAGLPVKHELARAEDLLRAMSHDKKVAESRIRFVLPEDLGRVSIFDDLEAHEIIQAFDRIRL